MKHYKEQLSAYLNHELPKEERQEIAEHLLLCADCRQEHDEMKFGMTLATQLLGRDAPENLWNEIENVLDGKKEPQMSLLPNFSFFNSHGLLATAGALLVVSGLVAAVYFSLFRETPKVAQNEPANVQNVPPMISPTNEIPANQNTNKQILSNINSNVQTANSNNQSSNSTEQISPKITPTPTNKVPNGTSTTWDIETLAGMPKVGNSTAANKLAVGEVLETDANSRAKIQVANIGNVEVAPNSRVKLVKTQSTEHRLSLEEGKLQAQINAPPRLFIVDTPSAVAVDWGCAYTLEVDKGGNSKLHVTSGYVALERNGRESIVPAGAMAVTKKGKGLGTPFSETATKDFQNELFKFDFANGGADSLNFILKNSRSLDTITLWNLLSTVSKNEREKVFNALISFVKLPDNTTKEGILNLDKKMLERLRWELENIWFS